MIKTKELNDLAQKIVNNSNGRIYIAHNEEDASKDKQMEAAHFLKLDKKRLGRDLELYEFMAKVSSWEQALTNILGEIILPLKKVDDVYKQVVNDFINWGLKVYPQDMHKQWKEIFA